MRKPWNLGLVLSIGLSSSLWGADAASGSKAAALELLRLMKTDQAMSAVLAENPKVAALLDSQFWDFAQSHLAEAYARSFTEGELREIIAFYKTPVGAKLLAKTPALLLEEKKYVEQFLIEHRAEIEATLRPPSRGVEPHAQPARQGDAAEPASKDPGEILRNRADLLFDTGKWAEARDAYLEYLKSDPQNADVITDLGSCYHQLGDAEAALREFDRALALDPDHWQTLFNKTVVLGFDLKRGAEAQSVLARLKALQPDNADVEKLAARLAEP